MANLGAFDWGVSNIDNEFGLIDLLIKDKWIRATRPESTDSIQSFEMQSTVIEK